MILTAALWLLMAQAGQTHTTYTYVSDYVPGASDEVRTRHVGLKRVGTIEEGK